MVYKEFGEFFYQSSGFYFAMVFGIWDLGLELDIIRVRSFLPDPCGTVTRRAQSDSNCKVILPD